MFDAHSLWLNERRVDLRYSAHAASAWVGAVRTDGAESDIVSGLRTRFESGVRFATSTAEVAINVSAGRRIRESSTAAHSAITLVATSQDSSVTRIDSIPGDPSDQTTERTTELVSIAELRASWSVGRFLLSTVAGRGIGPRSSPVIWGIVEAATPLHHGPLAFLNAGYSAAPGYAEFAGVPRRSLSVGLRFSSATFASRAIGRNAADAAATAFSVTRESSGEYRLRVRVPNALAVELASDCTGWKAVALSRRDGSAWEIVLPVSAGPHLVNIRIDGGAWIAPAGLVAKTDDFAGAVGVFVVD